MTESFTCAECGQTFGTTEGWTDDDAFSEAIDRFGAIAFEEKMEAVCEPCYDKAITAAMADGRL